jgi:hypothetical protein
LRAKTSASPKALGMTEISLTVPGYADIKKVGDGGFADVYAAVQEGTGRRVALKVLRTRGGDGERRFNVEAKILGTFSVLTTVKTDDGRPGIVVDLMDGHLQERPDRTAISAPEFYALFDGLAMMPSAAMATCRSMQHPSYGAVGPEKLFEFAVVSVKRSATPPLVMATTRATSAWLAITRRIVTIDDLALLTQMEE